MAGRSRGSGAGLGGLGRASVRLAELAARYRSELAGRRLLVVLDNARSAEQVRPLLPGRSSSLLVTSRDSLAGLVARDGAHRIFVDPLPEADAVGLLRTLLGPRVDAEAGPARALAQACDRLPLALRIAAELAASQPTSPLADLRGALSDEHRTLDLLDAGGDPGTMIRTVFSWSYHQLSPDAARAFRLIGLQPGRDVSLDGVAALTGSSARQAWRSAGELVRATLLRQIPAGRYAMPDLLRAYARELAGRYDSDADRQAALTRLLSHDAATATGAAFNRRVLVPPAGPPAHADRGTSGTARPTAPG